MVKQGIALKIMTNHGTEEALKVLCSFNYDTQNYLLAIDKNGDCVCRKIGFNLWSGMHIDADPDEDEVLRIASLLLTKASANKEFYKFKAEHYVAKCVTEGIRFGKRKKLKILDKRMKLVPFFTRLLLAEFFALMYAFLCIRIGETAVVANVFSIAARSEQVAATYLVQAFGALLLFLVRASNREWLDLYINSFIPHNAVLLVGLLKSSGEVRTAAVLVAVGSLLIWILPKIIQAIKCKRKTQKTKLLKTALRRCYAPFAICLCVAYLAAHYLGFSVYNYESDKYENVDVQSLETFRNAKDCLESEKWKTCSDQEKLDALQVICNYECKNILGCNSPKVVAAYPDNDATYGSYNPQTNTITVSIEHLANDSAESVLSTLLHETRHAYQRAAVDAFNAIEKTLGEERKALYCFRAIEAYRDNFDNYTEGNDDYYAYYDQETERDSRTWAEWRIMSEYYYYLYPRFYKEQTSPMSGGNCLVKAALI